MDFEDRDKLETRDKILAVIFFSPLILFIVFVFWAYIEDGGRYDYGSAPTNYNQYYWP